MGLPAMLVAFLTGRFPLSAESQAFWMAFQGVMAVRGGVNKSKSMYWFHAFCLSVVCGYGGALLAPIWMGRATSMLSDDLNVASCIISFVLVNYLPYNIGYKIGSLLPISIVTVLFSQLFRTMGIVKYVHIAFNAFKDHPSEYYPIPVFGPILFATMLGNMSSFFLKGFHGHVEYGMPWPFQNGLFCATFYHFFVNDEKGIVGTSLRGVMHSQPLGTLGLDDQTFALVVVSAFMQICGLLQMPEFLGPTFSPFTFFPRAFSVLAKNLGARLRTAEGGALHGQQRPTPGDTSEKSVDAKEIAGAATKPTKEQNLKDKDA